MFSGSVLSFISGDVINEIESPFLTPMVLLSGVIKLNASSTHAQLEKNNIFQTTPVCFGREIWSTLCNMLRSLGAKSRRWKSKVMAFLGFRETFCTSTGPKGGFFSRIYSSLGMSQRPQKCNPNKQLNYKDELESALIIVPPAREKWRRGESQQTRGSCQLPCSSNWFHERGDECVCLCRMFTDPNEPTVKKKKKASYLLGCKLQWCGSKVKVAWLRSYCTYTLDHKIQKWNGRWQNERKDGGGSWFCQLAKSAYNYFKCFLSQ